jgi:hypothetical protein
MVTGASRPDSGRASQAWQARAGNGGAWLSRYAGCRSGLAGRPQIRFAQSPRMNLGAVRGSKLGWAVVEVILFFKHVLGSLRGVV